MDRRTALYSTFLLGGLMARAARGQGGRGGFRPSPSSPDEPALDPSSIGYGPEPTAPVDVPPNPTPQPSRASGTALRPQQLIDQQSLTWGVFDIAPYTSIPQHSKETSRPEGALIEWIFRFTGSDAWHGEVLSTLSATPDTLYALHNEEMLDRVDRIYERFVDAWFNVLTLRARIIAATDPRWRYDVFSLLEPIRLGREGRGGPQGQQAWTVDSSTAERLVAARSIDGTFRVIEERKEPIVNGQTLFLQSVLKEPATYRAGLELSNSVALGFEPHIDSIEEGVELRISPLLAYDGTTVDLALDLRATVARRNHQTRVIVPRKIGDIEQEIDVPEVAHTRLNQTIPSWPLDKTLIVSAGILPGIFMNKGGALNLGIGAPTQTELLVILDMQSNLEMARRRAPRR